WRARAPFEPEMSPDLSGTPVYLAAGRSDQMVPPESTERLAELLKAAGAEVTLDWQPGGHGIGRTEIEAARSWLKDVVARTS
ncbi:MAG: dienelactone hydrolase family protein, partial [Rubrobacter sp.]|nr:dienelactone hydrolase family protein [Rubrobacter sp.]